MGLEFPEISGLGDLTLGPQLPVCEMGADLFPPGPQGFEAQTPDAPWRPAPGEGRPTVTYEVALQAVVFTNGLCPAGPYADASGLRSLATGQQ